MAFPFLAEIERLINERGSAAIMKERLALAAEQYAALEKKLADAEARTSKAEADSQRFELETLRLKDQLRTVEGKFAANQTARLGEVREAILVLLSNRSWLSTDDIAHELGIRGQLALFHLTEMHEADLLSASHGTDSATEWTLDQKARAYMVQHGLLQ